MYILRYYRQTDIMGSDQSSHARERADPSLVLQSPTTAALREGAMSPGRQDSVCSDTDVPYVSYTVNKPIGESPKKVANKSKGRGQYHFQK